MLVEVQSQDPERWERIFLKILLNAYDRDATDTAP